MIENLRYWLEYFDNLSDIEKNSYCGNCPCDSCQNIVKGYHDYLKQKGVDPYAKQKRNIKTMC